MKNFIIRKLFWPKRYWRVFPVFLALVAAAQDDVAWKSKQIAEWSEEDAKQVLSDSPWAKSVTPTLTAPKGGGQTSGGRGRGAGIGRGGIGIGGVGISLPGMGGRRGMGGSQGGGSRGGGRYPGGQSTDSSPNEPPKLLLRWESAMPVRTAELKVRDNNAPVLDDKHYAIAVYGVPGRMLIGEAKKLGDQLKKEATLKRDGKKDFKPSSVEVIDRSDGPVVVYMFSRSNEITHDDHRIEFDAKIGRLDVIQSFFVDDMVWQGKREL